MSLPLACPHCRRLTKVDASWAGHTVACPHCKQQFQVPPAAPVMFEESPAPAVSVVAPRRRSGPVIFLGILLIIILGGVPWLVWYVYQGKATEPALTEEEEARAVVAKALDGWRLGDGRLKIAARHNLEIADEQFARGSVLLSYELGPSFRVTGQVPGLEPGQVGCHVSATLIRQTPDRKEFKENKQFLLSRGRDQRWRLGDANPLRSAELGKPERDGANKAAERGPHPSDKKQIQATEEKKNEEEKRRRAADPRYWINFLTSQDETTRTAARQNLLRLGEEAVGALAQALEDDSERVRQSAVELLGKIGPKARGAVLHLTRYARKADAAGRKQCEAALVRIGPLTKDDVPAVLDALRYRDPDLRRLAIETLQRFGREAAPARQALVDILNGTDPPELQRAAVELLAQLPPRAADYPVLIQISKSSNTELRVAAKVTLQKWGPPPKAEIGDLLRLLKAEKPELKLLALEALRLMGAESRPAVTEFIQLLKDTSPSVRRAALESLTDFSAEARPSLPLLLKLTKDENSAVRSSAGRLLGKLGAITRDDVPILVASLRDADARQREVAIEALAGLGADAEAATPAVIERLAKANEPESLKILLMQTLSKLGPKGRVAKPTLAHVLKSDSSEEVRRTAAATLASFGEEAVPDLIEAVKTGDDKAKALATEALAKVGPAAVNPLVSALKLTTPEDRPALAKTVGALGEPAVPALREALKDKAFAVRMGACEALTHMGPPAKDAVPDLMDALGDDFTNVQIQAARALERIGPPAVPALIDAVRFSDRTRIRAVLILGQIGPAAKEAVPALTEALKDKDQQIRLEAEKALRKIRKTP